MGSWLYYFWSSSHHCYLDKDHKLCSWQFLQLLWISNRIISFPCLTMHERNIILNTSTNTLVDEIQPISPNTVSHFEDFSSFHLCLKHYRWWFDVNTQTWELEVIKQLCDHTLIAMCHNLSHSKTESFLLSLSNMFYNESPNLFGSSRILGCPNIKYDASYLSCWDASIDWHSPIHVLFQVLNLNRK